MEKEKKVIEWNSSLTVDEDTIDKQHTKLLDQINKLYNEFMRGEEESLLNNTILFLDEYIHDHLSYEEEYMKKHNYPGLPEHKRIHIGFIEAYEKFKEKLAKKGYASSLAIEIQKFLGSWWLDHIAIVDHKYAEYIEEHDGIK